MSKRWPSELDICLDRENCWTPFPFSVKLIKLQGTRDTWKDIERTEIRGIGSLGPRSFFLRTKERKRGETRSLSAGLRLWFFFSFPFAVLIIPLPVLSIKKKKKNVDKISIDSTLDVEESLKRFIFISDQRPTLSPRVDGRTICISQQEDVILVPSSRQTKLSNWRKGEGVILIPYYVYVPQRRIYERNNLSQDYV